MVCHHCADLVAASLDSSSDETAWKAFFRSMAHEARRVITSAKLLEVLALRFGGFFVSWLLGCFALAAIATVVNRLDADDDDLAWKHDSHQRAREHLGSIVLAAAFTFCVFRWV